MAHQGKFDTLTKELITHVMGFQEGEENFVRSEQFVLSNLLYHHCLAVNSHAVRRSIDGLSLKFNIHGQQYRAQKLSTLTSRFLASPLFKDHYETDIEWSLLSLILHLSSSPTQVPVTEAELSPVVCRNTSPSSSQDLSEEQIDWATYLLEGEKEYVVGPEEPLSDWSDTDDNEETNQQDCSEVMKNTDSNKNLHAHVEEEVCVRPKPVVIGQEFKLVEKSHRARSWLSSNTHMQYWRGAGFQQEALSSHLTANVASVWEEAKGVERSQCISEWAVMREVIWQMICPVSSYIFHQNEDGDFVVRTKLTVSSLTPRAAAQFLEQFCTPLKQWSELVSFLQNYECPELDPPTPVTLLAYVSGLHLWRQQFHSHLCCLETIVKKQETTCTVSWLESELNPWFRILSAIYTVHYAAFIAFPEVCSRSVALRLIGSLCEGVEGAAESDVRSVLLRLLLHTLRHYFTIMHNWLVYGTLVDHANEFIIQRNESVNVTDEAFWREAFTLSCHPGSKDLVDGDPIKTGLKILIPLAVALTSMGKSQELLSSLNIKPFYESNSDCCLASSKVENKTEKSLEEVLLEHVTMTISKSMHEENGITDENKENVTQDMHTNHKNQSAFFSMPENNSSLHEVDQHVVATWQQEDFTHIENILAVADPLLMSDSSDNEEEEGLPYQPMDCLGSKIEKIRAVPRAVSVLSFLSSSLRPLITQKQNELNVQLWDVLIKEYRLDRHCRAVHSILLMEAGDVMYEFYSHLFTKLDHGESVDSISLTLHLEYCIARLYPDLAKLFSVAVEGRCDADDTDEKDGELDGEVLPVKSEVDATAQQLSSIGLPNISIYYQAPWPINLLLTEDIMNKFNMLFRFSLSLKRATNGLERLKFRDMASWNVLVATGNIVTDESASPLKSRMHRLQLLRLWLLCFARELHNYFATVVFLPYHQAFEQLLKSKPSFSEIIRSHDKLLNRVVTLCLMGKESKVSPLQVVLNKVFRLTQQLSYLWMKDIGRVSSEELTSLEAQYTQVHRFLVTLLNRLTTTRFLPHLEGMTRALATTMPLLAHEF